MTYNKSDFPILSVPECEDFLNKALSSGIIYFKNSKFLIKSGCSQKVKDLFKLHPINKILRSYDFLRIYLNKRCEISKCKKCGRIVTPGTTECCQCHKFQPGELNPMWHKEVDDSTRKCISESSKKLWQDPEYRRKVKEGTTGVKRSDEFKETQRRNAYKQFKDPNQRSLRSEKMKQFWREGKLIPSDSTLSYSKSKEEIECMIAISQGLGEDYNILKNQKFRYTKEDKAKWLLPDLIYKNIILEFNGNYWHCNPDIFSEDFIVEKSKKKAADIWASDNLRYEIFNELGYHVIIIWESFFKEFRKSNKYVEKVIYKIQELELLRDPGVYQFR